MWASPKLFYLPTVSLSCLMSLIVIYRLWKGSRRDMCCSSAADTAEALIYSLNSWARVLLAKVTVEISPFHRRRPRSVRADAWSPRTRRSWVVAAVGETPVCRSDAPASGESACTWARQSRAPSTWSSTRARRLAANNATTPVVAKILLTSSRLGQQFVGVF